VPAHDDIAESRRDAGVVAACHNPEVAVPAPDQCCCPPGSATVATAVASKEPSGGRNCCLDLHVYREGQAVRGGPITSNPLG
jgi:hypothetical protein